MWNYYGRILAEYSFLNNFRNNSKTEMIKIKGKEINLTIDESIGNKNFTKISFLQIVRKYLSKKLRTVIRKK